MKEQNNDIIGIYKIISPSNKIYIGQSINCNSRINNYKKLYNCKGQVLLYRSFLKYGVENHIFEIIEECSLEQLNEREIYWIEKLNLINDGLNIRMGGRGGGKNTEKQKIYLREKHSHRSKPIIQYDLNGNFIKEWVSINDVNRNLGIDMSALIQCLKNKKQTSTNGYMWVYKEKYISKNIDPISNNKLKPIEQIDIKTGVVVNSFYSIKEAILYLQLNSIGSGISSVLKGRQKQAYGYMWRYSTIR